MHATAISTSDATRISPTIFREYDIRGAVDDTLTEDAATRIGWAFAEAVKVRIASDRTPVIALGYDGRTHSPRLEKAVITGITAAGVNVVRIGLGPTPMLYMATTLLPADAGLMITGSHNPPHHNGMKMLCAGAPFFGKDIQALKAFIETHSVPDNTTNATMTSEDIRERYLETLLAAYDTGPNTLKVAWDAGNGAAGEMVEQLIARLPGQHIPLFTEIDGTFPNHHPDPTVPENMADLIRTVREEGCDFGIAFDGDGDRIGVVDNRGEILWGDQLLQFFAEDILAEHPGAPIIADVKASQLLFDRIHALGGQPVMWKTGHSLVKSKMAELNAPLAGEMSGHIFFGDHYNFDDALYAAVKLLALMAKRSNTTLADMRSKLPQAINTPEIRIPCREEQKFAAIENIQKRLNEEGATYSDVDGIRMQTADGWWLLRASNTQSVLVARCEATSAEALEELKELVSRYLKEEGIEATL